MKIHEAAQIILADAGRPMHPRDIYSQILNRGLFKFGAKDPVSIVAQALRKKSAGSGNSGKPIFIRYPNNTYGLTEWDNSKQA